MLRFERGKDRETRLGNTGRDKVFYERQIRIVDAHIDKRVYELYRLTEAEVKVVEGV